jgi:hypothetical protein
MDNFGIVLDKDRRYRGRFSTLVVLEGVNEYYENMKNIIRHNMLTTKEIYNAGYDAFKEIANRKRSEERENKLRSSKKKSNSNDTTKVESIIHKIYEIWQLIRYKEAESYASELFKDQQMASPIEIYSRSVQDEITFVYYLNLLSRYQGMDLPFMKEWTEKPERLGNPYEILAKIQEEDDEIDRWFSGWMKDIRQYKNETFEIIKNYEETKHFVSKEEGIDEEEAKSWI